MQPDLAKVAPFLFAALLVFAVYRRFRRTFGPQPLRPVRMSVRIVLFAVIGCSLKKSTLKKMFGRPVDNGNNMSGIVEIFSPSTHRFARVPTGSHGCACRRHE